MNITNQKVNVVKSLKSANVFCHIVGAQFTDKLIYKAFIISAIKLHRVHPTTGAVNSQEQDLHNAYPDKSFTMDDL